MAFSLHHITPNVKRKARKRVGRGNASGHGTFAGRGTKGQKARTGGGIRPGFEGGRTTLIMQTPKKRGKGFHSLKADAEGINVDKLNRFKDGDVVTLKTLISSGLAHTSTVKILGNGDLKKKLEIRVPVSKTAKEKIEKIGGSIIIK